MCDSVMTDRKTKRHIPRAAFAAKYEQLMIEINI